MALLKNTLRQDAVYWAPSGLDSFGRPTFDEPVEMLCRWESSNEEYIQPDGTPVVSSATVFVDRDVRVGGMLFLGVLAEIDSGELDDPRAAGALEIKVVRSVPTLRGNTSIRSAVL